MKTIIFLVAVLAISIAGCSKAPQPTTPDPNEVLVEVNGISLTRTEAIRQVKLRLGGPPPSDLTEERIGIIRTRTLSQVIDQFVKRTLLLEEADRLKIVATEEEIAKGLEIIKANTEKGQQPHGIMQDGPAGDNSIRNEIITGIRVDKLIAQKIPTNEPTEDEINAFIEKNRKNITHPEKGLMPRDRIINIIKNQMRKKELFNYVKSLQEKAEIKHSPSVRPPIYAEE